MIWLVWRQQRAQVSTGLGIVLGLAVVWLVILVETSGCATYRDCDAPFTALVGEYYPFINMGVVLLSIVLGLFAGGPLFAREFEERTHAFVITQAGHHGRWVTAKLLIAAVPVALALTGFGVFIAIVHDRAPLPMLLLQNVGYVSHGPLLGGWFLLAFAFAALIGVLGRRSLPAMVLALVAVIPVSMLVAQVARPAVLPPLRTTEEISQADRESGDPLPTASYPMDDGTLIDSGYLSSNGTVLDDMEVYSCSEESCLTEVAVAYADYYMDDDFWTLQVFDLAAYALAALMILAFTTHRLSHRRL